MKDKRLSFSRCIDSYNYEKFYNINISGLYYKLITIVIDTLEVMLQIGASLWWS